MALRERKARVGAIPEGGMADIADLCVKVRHHIRHNGGQALREETLLP